MKILSNSEYKRLHDRIKRLEKNYENSEDDVKYYKNNYEFLLEEKQKNCNDAEELLANEYDYIILVKGKETHLYNLGKKEEGIIDIEFSHNLLNKPELTIVK